MADHGDSSLRIPALVNLLYNLVLCVQRIEMTMGPDYPSLDLMNSCSSVDHPLPQLLITPTDTCQDHYPVSASLYHRDRSLRWLTGITGSVSAHQGKIERKECGVALDRAKVPPEKSKDFQGPT